MKTKSIIVSMFVFALGAFSVITVASTGDSGNFFVLNSALAQVQPPDGGFTPGGGDKCSGAVCSQANGNRYGDWGFNGNYTCCGIVTTTSGDREN